jgi:ABC-type sugar transport system substrate-binding protein
MNLSRESRRRSRATSRLALVCVSSAIMLALAGPTMSTASSSPRGKSVALVSCIDAVPWCNAFNKAIQKQLSQKGVHVTVLTDAFDATVQNQHMDQAIASHPEAILVLASNAQAITSAISRAKSAGVPVVNLDAPISKQGVALSTFQVVADHYKLGVYSAMGLVRGLKAEGLLKGNVTVIAGAMASATAQLRLAGFKSYLAKYPQYKIVSVQDSAWDATKAGQIAQQLFAQYRSRGGIQGVYAMNDLLAVAAINAAKQAGIKVGYKNKGVIVTGGNCLAPGIAAIKNGLEYSSATQSPVPEAASVVEHTLAFLSGAKEPLTVVVPEAMITQQNVGKYVKECTF